MTRSTPFNSFFMGGFECSTHRDRAARRLDLINSTKHDIFAEADYTRMLELGMSTARDGVRWHLIETEPFTYDFSSLKHQVDAVRKTGIQIIWDYFHYGYPDDLDIFSPGFAERFAAFSDAVTRHLLSELGDTLIICPINEISFFSWIAGDKGLFHPHATSRGNELKKKLVTAATLAIDQIKAVAPNTTITFTEPAIHVVPKDDTTAAKRAAESYRRAQFHALDMLSDRSGDMDIIGLNYYFHNQWRHPSRRKIPRGHKQYRPLREILAEFYARYNRPLFIAETGIEDDERADWFRYVCDEVHAAIETGIPILAICLYPICNHPGWADNRHCHNGLWDYPDDTGNRDVHEPLAEEIRRQTARFSATFKDQVLA